MWMACIRKRTSARNTIYIYIYIHIYIYVIGPALEAFELGMDPYESTHCCELRQACACVSGYITAGLGACTRSNFGTIRRFLPSIACSSGLELCDTLLKHTHGKRRKSAAPTRFKGAELEVHIRQAQTQAANSYLLLDTKIAGFAVSDLSHDHPTRFCFC